MSKSTQPARSVRDIKTLAGKADDLLSPHKIYMRLFALETERHRRLQERASAMQRIESIDTRCAEIDLEKSQLLGILEAESLPAAGVRAPRACATADGRQGSGVGGARGAGQRGSQSGAQMPPFDPVRIRY